MGNKINKEVFDETAISYDDLRYTHPKYISLCNKNTFISLSIITALSIHSFIEGLPNLTTFSVGEDVFLILTQLIVYGIPSLQSVSIGSKSCPSCSLTVVENPNLRNIIIGEKAFMKGQLKVSECI